MSDERKEQFKAAIKNLNSSSKGTDILIDFIPDMSVEVERFSSGSLILDSIIGGGYPKGRIIEIYGPESSGKTTLAITAIANVQREGGNCVFIDVEQAFDQSYAANLGVDIDNLAFAQPSIAETVLGMIVKLAESGAVDLIVVDSVAAMIPREEMEGGIEKQTMALLARLMSRGLRSIAPAASQNKCTIMFLNQVRDKVGVFYGPNTETPGGRALKFFASQRIEVRRSKTIEEGDDVIGTEVKLKCVKNKVSAPFGTGLTVFTFAKGVNRNAELVVLAEELGVLKKKGHTYWFIPDITVPEDQWVKVGVYTKGAISAIENDETLYNMIAKITLETLEQRNKQGLGERDEN